jgi:diguanylate cyclase (GGDEF)-like protein
VFDRLSAFFCPTEADRERLLELEQHLRGARLATFAALGAGLAAMGPWLGWAPIALCIALLLTYEMLVRRRLAASGNPAVVVLSGFVLTTSTIVVAAIVSGGPSSPILPWLVVPIVSLAGRFDTRGVWTGTVFAMAMLVVVALTDLGAFRAEPPRMMALVPLVFSVGLFSVAMERVQRTESALDPLTGLLNRKSLHGRFAELAEQARLTGDPVTLLALDLDHFKVINDSYGHARGDVVLREVAAAIRGQLRSFELAYRMGGEEFVVVLPGVDLAHGVEVAERLRRGIRELLPDGLEVSVSVGVCAGAGQAVSFEPLYEAADAALYAAKRAGRNRVQVAEGPPDLRVAA